MEFGASKKKQNAGVQSPMTMWRLLKMTNHFIEEGDKADLKLINSFETGFACNKIVLTITEDTVQRLE